MSLVYVPRPGTKTEAAIDFIRRKLSARTDEIAEHIGSASSSVQALLATAVEVGMLVACKVEVPGKPPMREYRIGSGMPSLANGTSLKTARVAPRRSELANLLDPQQGKAAQPEVAQNTGSALSEPLHGCTSTEERTVTRREPATPSQAQKGRGIGPAAASGSAGCDLKLWLDKDGVLDVLLPESDKTIHLKPAQVRQLGTFLAHTQGVWNS